MFIRSLTKMVRSRKWYEEGTTSQEVLLLILPSFLFAVIAKYLTNIFFKSKDVLYRFTLEFFVIVMPMVLVFTILAEYTAEVLIFVVIIVIRLFMFSFNVRNDGNIKEKVEVKSKNLDFITNARSTINILTGIAILAVDFQLFPGRFTKTKKFGFSLMDVGVGLYVYSNGIVSPEIRGHANSFNRTLKSVIPLLVLGIARFIVTSQIGYHVHVSEYGVHWNFFITLAVTKLISSCMLMAIDIKFILIQGVLLLMTHETLIQLAFEDYVFSPKLRDSFVSANREGICSALGYVALHFLSIAIGKWLDIKSMSSKKFQPILFAKLIITIVILLIGTVYTYGEYNISRCLANSTYCLWILFIGVLMTTLFYMSDVVQDYIFGVGNIQVPVIFEGINYNGLVYFLISNLLTGLVNIVFKTQDLEDEISIIILFLYMLATCCITVLLYIYSIKIKL